MTLELDGDQVRLLHEVLGLQLRALLAEIAHTDDRAFRDDLRIRHQHLDDIRQRLAPLAGG